jgi:hypothetical protein
MEEVEEVGSVLERWREIVFWLMALVNFSKSGPLK